MKQTTTLGRIKYLLRDKNKRNEYIGWLFSYAKPFLPQISLLLLIDLLLSGTSIGLALVGKSMIDKASDGQDVYKYVTMYILIVAASLAASVVSQLVSVVVYEKFGFGIRKKVYRRMLQTNWLDITKYHSGDLMTRLTSDVSAVATGIISTIPTVIRLIFQLGITFITLAVFDWKLAVFSLMVAPIAAVASMIFGRKVKHLQIKVQETESAYRSFMQESLANILIVKAFRTEDYSENRLSELRDDRVYWALKKTRMGVAAQSVMNFSFQIGYIAAFVIGVVGIKNNTLTFGTMTVFLTLVNQVQGPILALAETIPSVVAIFASADRIMELQDLKEEEVQEENLKPEGVGLKINDLSFSYVENEPIFVDADMEFRPGEFTAIVGRSGIGKTTLIRLIMAFTNKVQGNIEFYNKYGQTESTNAGVREFISYVPQGNTLFSGTIRENVCFGGVNATEDEIAEALKGAAAYDFVQELPNGIDTKIGEKGYGISEGQAQRIAIARALLKKAPFLILDEATASLDPETELKVLRGLQNWNPRPTCLLISHRMSVLEYCDNEIKIENHKIVTVPMRT